MKFRKIWNEEKDAWLMRNKGVPPRVCYEFFLLDFPEASDVTFAAFQNERSRIGAVLFHSTNTPRTPRPLYAEQVKKGYVRIKIAQPNVWISKAKWVYMETHPWEDFSERSNYIFLDGDNRNFSPDNIERAPIKVMGLFNRMGGTGETADITRIRLALAKLKSARLDAGEKLGLTVNYGVGRMFREDVNRRQREWSRAATKDPKKRAKRNAWARAYLAKKRQDPEWVERRRKYANEWAKKKRRERDSLRASR